MEKHSPPTGPPTESGSSSPPTRAKVSKLTAKRRRRTASLFKFDREIGTRFVAGADEAGRGSLAGPLVAAGVLIDYRSLRRSERLLLAGLDDSKRKTEPERERLYEAVLMVAARVVMTARSAPGIDSRGLHVTNLEALGDCLERVWVPGTTCLSDGFRVRCKVDHDAVVGGDGKSAAIAAASMIAKVTRDRYMRRIAPLYPQYGFESNVGYASSGHREAILEHGICPLHRRSFASTAYTQLQLEIA